MNWTHWNSSFCNQDQFFSILLNSPQFFSRFIVLWRYVCKSQVSKRGLRWCPRQKVHIRIVPGFEAIRSLWLMNDCHWNPWLCFIDITFGSDFFFGLIAVFTKTKTHLKVSIDLSIQRLRHVYFGWPKFLEKRRVDSSKSCLRWWNNNYLSTVFTNLFWFLKSEKYKSLANSNMWLWIVLSL